MKQFILLSVFFISISVLQAQIIKPKKVLIKQKKMDAVKVEKKVDPRIKDKFIMINSNTRKNNCIRESK